MTGKQLAEHRERLGLSRTAAARRAGVSLNGLLLHEKAESLANLHQRSVKGYARAYGLTIVEIRSSDYVVADGRKKYQRTKKARRAKR